MSVSSIQPEKQHLYCLMVSVATPATPLVASSAMQTLQLSLGGDDFDCGVTLVEDEAGTEFKFCDDEPTSVFPSSAASSSERLYRHWVSSRHIGRPLKRRSSSRSRANRNAGKIPSINRLEITVRFRRAQPRPSSLRPDRVSWYRAVIEKTPQIGPTAQSPTPPARRRRTTTASTFNGTCCRSSPSTARSVGQI